MGLNTNIHEIKELISNGINILFVDNTLNQPSFIEKNDSNQSLLQKVFAIKNFSGEFNQIVECTYPLTYESIAQTIFCGLGEKDLLDYERIKKLANSISEYLDRGKIKQASIFVENRFFDDKKAAYFIEELQFCQYKFNKYFVAKASQHKIHFESVDIFTDIDSLKKQLPKINNKIEGVTVARNLVSEPGNVIYPETIVDFCKRLTEFGLEINVLTKAEMEREGMNLLLGVAKGSTKDPYSVMIKWHGDKNCKFEENLLAIVGKGVTFDTGGINIKQNPTNMKCDMAGAAAVIGTMLSIAKNKTPKNIIGAIGLVENMPSGDALKPDDVLVSMSKKTVEIDNTDAEGRLVLADLICYVQKYYKTKTIIDLATLTGAISICLGDYYAGLFSNNEELATNLISAGQKSQDLLWRLPVADYYDTFNESHIADIKNCARVVGSVTAAQFLKFFVEPNVAWAHIDIAGVAFKEKYSSSTSVKRATGFGVRLLLEYVNNLS